jgi:hypothetical protein
LIIPAAANDRFEIVKLGTRAWFSIVTVAPEVLLLSTKFAFA